MLQNISQKAKEIWDFYREYSSKYWEIPTYRKASEKLGMAVGKIHLYVQELEKAGFVKKSSSWGIVLSNNDLNVFPVVWKVSCGKWNNIEDIDISPYDDFQWEIEIPKTIIKERSGWYVLKAEGDSMTWDRIFDWDFLIIKNQSSLNDWEIWVISIKDGFEEKVTLKRIKNSLKPNEIILQPSNKKIPPIILKWNEDITVKGKLVWVIRNFK